MSPYYSTLQSSEFLDKVYMTFIHMKPCARVCKKNTNYNIKDPLHTRLNSYKGARLYNCAAVATCNSDTCILSLVNH